MVRVLPAFLFIGMSDANKLFLIALGYSFAPTLVTLLGIPIHFCLCWTFVITLELGFYGVTYAMVLTHLIIIIAFHCYTMKLDKKVTDALKWPGWAAVLSDWGEYLGLGIPGAIMITLEWLCFEFLVIMSGWLGV